jgi:hypothetical protein
MPSRKLLMGWAAPTLAKKAPAATIQKYLMLFITGAQV